jgi:DNA-3-methyladenine glycosylase II
MQQAKIHLQQDVRLVNAVKTVELPLLEADTDVYRALLRSIISQQLSTKAASTIYSRFLSLFEGNYPHLETVINLDIETMRGVGLSRQKATYIQNVAHFFLKNPIPKWEEMTDDEIIAYLTPIKGVGKWTVEMILIFTLNRLDVLPLDDLAIRNKMVQLYNVTETGKALKEQLTEIAENWRPYRSVACRYLWLMKDSAIAFFLFFLIIF